MPLWQGSDEPRIAQGATRLAEMLAPSTVRHILEPDFGTLHTHPRRPSLPRTNCQYSTPSNCKMNRAS